MANPLIALAAPWTGFTLLPGGPFTVLKAVTPDDDADLPDGLARGIMVFAAGDVTWLDAGGNEHALTGLVAGDVIPCAASRVKEATTATVKAGY